MSASFPTSPVKRRILSVYLAQCPESWIEKRRSTVLSRMVSWSYQYSPFVEADALPKDPATLRTSGRLYCGINLDVTGMERLYGGEEALLKRILQEFEDRKIGVKLAIAPTLGAAWAVSRFGKKPYNSVSPEDVTERLPLLPVTGLRLSAPVTAALHELSLFKIKDIIKLPRGSLAERFGKELLQRLDQAQGLIEEPIREYRMARPLQTHFTFDAPVYDWNPFVYVTQELFESLWKKLVASDLKVRVLFYEVKKPDACPLRYTIPFTFPTQDRDHAWKVLKKYLEKTDVSTGISALSLSALDTRRLEAFQCEHAVGDGNGVSQPSNNGSSHGRNGSAHANGNSSTNGHSHTNGHGMPFKAEQEGALLDTLTAELGASRVCAVNYVESHIPEKSFHYESFKSAFFSPKKKDAKAILASRPSILFMAPRSVRAMGVLPDGPPFWLRWHGKTLTIRTAIGPERIAPEWWGDDEGMLHTRDYFRVELHDGTWAWVFREHAGGWFVHGIWA